MTRAAVGTGKQGETPLLEWLASIVGGVLLLGMIGIIGREALTNRADEPPAINVVVSKIDPTSTGYVLSLKADNKSGATAAAVEVEATLSDDGKVLEVARATLDYVPGHGTAEGGVFFTRDPRRHRLTVRPLGFQTP